jgi:hypothetical protein
MIKEQIQVEPKPPGHHSRLGGHHWVQHIDFDGREHEVVVLQWNPGVQRWSHSGNVGTGIYVDTKGWKYLRPCPMPGPYEHKDMLQIRDFHIIGDAQSGYLPIDALCQFYYKEYLVSVSTAGISMGGCQNHVCVFHKPDTKQVAKDGFHTVEEAINWIDNPNKEI